MNPPGPPADAVPYASMTPALRPDGTWSDPDERARRLIAARRWHRRAELAARRAARASSAVR